MGMFRTGIPLSETLRNSDDIMEACSFRAQGMVVQSESFSSNLFLRETQREAGNPGTRVQSLYDNKIVSSHHHIHSLRAKILSFLFTDGSLQQCLQQFLAHRKGSLSIG